MSNFVPLRQAAKQLETTPDALRKRLQRGRIQGKKDSSGKWLVDVGHEGGQSVYLSHPKVDIVEEASPPKNQREIELLQSENDKLNERFDKLMLVNEQLIKQHENEQVLRRDMQTQLTGLTTQLGQLRSEHFPLLEDKSRLQAEHKSLKGAVMDLIKHISKKNKP
tara:strand:- start:635 stop:1129 length:495 start_codon:yes stop_codon:yes gene_type:complete